MRMLLDLPEIIAKVPFLSKNEYRVPQAGNYDTAILRYSLTGDGEVNLLTTNVPDSFRGEGIAAHLAKVWGDL